MPGVCSRAKAVDSANVSTCDLQLSIDLTLIWSKFAPERGDSFQLGMSSGKQARAAPEKVVPLEVVHSEHLHHATSHHLPVLAKEMNRLEPLQLL